MKKKIQSGILLVAGVIAAVIGIAAGVAGMQGETRGYLLVTGVILIMLGFLRSPVRHHDRIVNVRPVQMTVLILNGLWIWNDYLLPSLLLGLNGRIKTLPIAVTSFVGSYVKQWDLILTAALLAMILIIILFLVAQKQIIQGVVDGAVK